MSSTGNSVACVWKEAKDGDDDSIATIAKVIISL